MPKKTEEKNLKVEPSTHRQIKTLAAQRGVSINSIVETAWSSYTALLKAAGSAKGLIFKNPEDLPEKFSAIDALIPKPAFSDLTENERRWMQDLLNILRSGNPEVISAVTENIKVFRQFARLETLETSKKRAKG